MTELERQIMQFEARWWRIAGSKESAIVAELGLKPTRYYQLLQQLAQREDVLATYPVLTKRLRRRMARKPARPAVGRLSLD